MQDYLAERPLLIERAEGCLLFDLDGNAYIDGVSSLWCNVHGHRVPELDEALRGQLDRVAHTTLLGLSNVPAARLARRLAELAPPGLTRVFFSDDGATAVEVALKMAFQFWHQCPQPRPRKTNFLSPSERLPRRHPGSGQRRRPGPLPSSVQPAVVPGYPRSQSLLLPLPAGIGAADLPDRLCRGTGAAGATARRHAGGGGGRAAGAGGRGMIVAPEGYLRRVREVTRACNVLLIADEVAVGFGRTGTMFACEQEDVVPDFLCLAKGLTGGYLPLAATLTTEEVFAAFLGRPEEGKTFYHGHTFTGNPLGAAVALASLDLLEHNGVAVPACQGRASCAATSPAWRNCPAVGDVRQRGLMAGIELVRDRATKERFPAAERMGQRVCRLARQQGVSAATAGGCGGGDAAPGHRRLPIGSDSRSPLQCVKLAGATPAPSCPGAFLMGVGHRRRGLSSSAPTPASARPS